MTCPRRLTRRIALVALIASAMSGSSLRAVAQVPAEAGSSTGGGGVVSGTGSVTIERLPTTLRVSVDLLGQGSDVKSALAKLADRREAARIQLTALKADLASVKIGDPVLSQQTPQERQQMQQLVMQQLRMRRRGEDNPIATLPKTVTVKATLTAHWPLNARDVESVLIVANELQEKIQAADLGGVNEKPELTPEQAELLEEMSQMRDEYGQQQAPEGEPSFAFVAKLSDAERDEAMAVAFQRAKQAAARLAAAAGSELGPLVSLASQKSNPGVAYDPYEYGYAYRQQYLGIGGGNDGSADDGEVVGIQPGKVSMQVTVSANFRLKP